MCWYARALHVLLCTETHSFYVALLVPAILEGEPHHSLQSATIRLLRYQGSSGPSGPNGPSGQKYMMWGHPCTFLYCSRQGKLWFRTLSPSSRLAWLQQLVCFNAGKSHARWKHSQRSSTGDNGPKKTTCQSFISSISFLRTFGTASYPASRPISAVLSVSA